LIDLTTLRPTTNPDITR